MPDPFGTLPAPLPLYILKAIDDFHTLGYLLQASPAANAYFEHCSCEIAEGLLGNSPRNVTQLFRVIALVRSKAAMIEHGLIAGDDGPDSLPAQIMHQWAAAQYRLVDCGTVFSGALRSFIISSTYMQPLAAAISEALTKTVIDPKQEDAVDRSIIHGPRIPWLAPECHSDTSKKYSPVGEAREQRAHRTLWRLELYYNILRLLFDSSLETLQWLARESLEEARHASIWMHVECYGLDFQESDEENTEIIGLPRWQREDIHDICTFFCHIASEWRRKQARARCHWHYYSPSTLGLGFST